MKQYYWHFLLLFWFAPFMSNQFTHARMHGDTVFIHSAPAQEKPVTQKKNRYKKVLSVLGTGAVTFASTNPVVIGAAAALFVALFIKTVYYDNQPNPSPKNKISKQIHSQTHVTTAPEIPYTFTLSKPAYALLDAIHESPLLFTHCNGNTHERALHASFVTITNDASMLYHHKPLAPAVEHIARFSAAGVTLIKEHNMSLAQHAYTLCSRSYAALMHIAQGCGDGFVSVAQQLHTCIRHPAMTAKALGGMICDVAETFHDILFYLDTLVDVDLSPLNLKLPQEYLDQRDTVSQALHELKHDLKISLQNLSLYDVGHHAGSCVATAGVHKIVSASYALVKTGCKQAKKIVADYMAQEKIAQAVSAEGVPFEYAVSSQVVKKGGKPFIPPTKLLASLRIFKFPELRMALLNEMEAEFLKNSATGLEKFMQNPVPILKNGNIIKELSSKTIAKYWGHIFSEHHIATGIMEVAKNSAQIISMITDIIEYIDQMGCFINEGLHTIITTIKDKKILIRVKLNASQCIEGLDAYKLNTNKAWRELGKIIYLEIE